MAKISVLLLYLRLFHAYNLMKIASYVLLFVVVSIVFATPGVISVFTRPDVGCESVKMSVGIVTKFNVATDFVISALPLPIVARMRLPMRQRLAVVGIFALAFL